MKSLFLILIFLYNLFFKTCLSSDIIKDEDHGKISITITSDIKSTDSQLYYNFKYLGDSVSSDGRVLIAKETENTQSVVRCFSIQRKPISAFALILYNDEGVEDGDQTYDNNDRTALATSMAQPKIRSISKINIRLTEGDNFQILVEPQYYLPPPFKSN